MTAAQTQAAGGLEIPFTQLFPVEADTQGAPVEERRGKSRVYGDGLAVIRGGIPVSGHGLKGDAAVEVGFCRGGGPVDSLAEVTEGLLVPFLLQLENSTVRISTDKVRVDLNGS